ncbi:MAG: Txe/YoeB family addiction module toxin [Gracilibacteraceae bacterium]|nr:Txe/YoeB family addiction module toxin [Gracilibacteraceae bacterium]
MLIHINLHSVYCDKQVYRSKQNLSRGQDKLLKDIDRNPFSGIGKPEPLTGKLQGFWSRRIDDANRIIYKVEGDQFIIAQCGRHYED